MDLPDAAAAHAGIRLHPARLSLHRAPAFAPGEERLRSFLNSSAFDGYCEASMQLAVMLAPAPDGGPVDAWKSWTSHRDEPADAFHTAEFRHVLPTPDTIAAQAALRALQGAGGVWFAGGYTRPYDAQETALLSAMDVAAALAPDSTRLAALRAGSVRP
jgi:predicted NAD/FAD-binding protein